MPTPTFTLRLPAKVQADLADMAKVYGSPNPRAFAREILEVMVSGDVNLVKAFNARLIAKVGEQLTLRLNAALDEATEGQKKPVEARKRARRVSRRAKR